MMHWAMVSLDSAYNQHKQAGSVKTFLNWGARSCSLSCRIFSKNTGSFLSSQSYITMHGQNIYWEDK